MLHQASQKIYENHQLIIDHLESHHSLSQDVEELVQSSHFYKKSNISSTSSPEPHYGMPPLQQFRVIKNGRQQAYDDGYRVTSSEPVADQMGPPPTPTKTLKVISSSEEPTSSIPDLGKCHSTTLPWFHSDVVRPDKINKSPLRRAPRRSRIFIFSNPPLCPTPLSTLQWKTLRGWKGVKSMEKNCENASCRSLTLHTALACIRSDLIGRPF